MESKTFTARVDDFERYSCGNGAEIARLTAQRWQALNHELGRYLAENLPTEQFQLFRVQRVTSRDPSQRCTVLELSLEVGRLTTRSRVQMIEPANDPFDDLRPTPLRPTQRQLQAIQDMQNAMGPMPQQATRQNPFGLSDTELQQRKANFERAFGIAKQSTEETPISGRKVLVDKHPQPA